MFHWIGNEAKNFRGETPWRVRRTINAFDRFRAFAIGFLLATCGIATAQALAHVQGWTAPAVGAGLAAVALVVL